MAKDLSKYRLHDEAELDPYKEKMGERAFYNYAISIYEALFKIKRDKPFDVIKNVKKDNLELFIKIACLFITDYPGTVLFNNEFTKLTDVRFRKR